MHDIYITRPRLRKQEYTFSLTDSGIVQTNEKGKEKKIEFGNIMEVNVSYIGEGMYRCLVKSKVDDRIQIPSHSSLGHGELKNQFEDFSAFLMEFHKKIGDNAKEIAFTKGHPLMFYLSIIIVTITALILASSFLALLIAGKKIMSGLEATLAIAFFLTMGIGTLFILKVKPKTYDPQKGKYPYDIDGIAVLVKKSETSSDSNQHTP